MSDEIKIEKSILEQIIERMITKLKDEEGFDEYILEELMKIDLSKNYDVKQLISKETEGEKNENTKA